MNQRLIDIYNGSTFALEEELFEVAFLDNLLNSRHKVFVKFVLFGLQLRKSLL